VSYIRKCAAWLRECLHTLYPFGVCWIGGLVMAVGWNDTERSAGLVVTVIAGLSFIWAIDLAYARGRARGESETAAKFVAALSTGDDTEISVNFNQTGITRKA
jgi:hypothetical protein